MVSKHKASTTRFAAVRVKAIPLEGTIKIDFSSRLMRVRGIVDVGMLREVLAAYEIRHAPHCGGDAMIGLPSGARVWLACWVTD